MPETIVAPDAAVPPVEVVQPAEVSQPVGPVSRVVGRHPRLWGVVFAVLLLVGYLVALRPARMWATEHIARPVFEAVDTPRAQGFDIVSTPMRPDALFAVPDSLNDGRDPRQLAREGGTAEWAAPVGVLFLLPAMFLLIAFPTRPFWLVLLAYHLIVGAISLAVFAVGLGWIEPAFRVYLFTRTYLTESVSLVVPLLLYLAARGAGPLAPKAPRPVAVEQSLPSANLPTPSS